MGNVGSSLKSLFGGCLVQVEDQPSPTNTPVRKQRKRTTNNTNQELSNSPSPADLSASLVGCNLQSFTLAELKVICQSFATSNFLGEGGFGPVYKGFIDEKIRPGMTPQAVAVKLLDLEGMQGHQEWLTEVILLGQLMHPHLVKLAGYCYEDEHRLLIYEFMTRGSLENHLFKRFFTPLPWRTRIKIAVGAAKGLAFLHGAEHPVIFRDFKASNILLDSDFNAKLSDFGLAKDGPQGDQSHVSTRVMGTEGYAAPEYIMTGHLTAKSDIYSFGVVLLELLTGRRSVDKTRPSREQNLVEWAKSSLNDVRKLDRIMDPGLEGQYSAKGAAMAASLAYQCLNYLPKLRPSMNAIVEALEPILELDDIPLGTFVYNAVEPVKEQKASEPKKEDTAVEKEARAQRREENPRRTPPRETGQQHNGRRQRNSSSSITDTALYRKSPRHPRAH